MPSTPSRRTTLGALLAVGSVALSAAPAHAVGETATRTVGAVQRTPLVAVATRTVHTAAKPTMTYQVQKGDTVWGIAQRTGSTVAAIISANGLSSNALIHPGQQLQIPSATSSAAATTSTTASSQTAASSNSSSAQQKITIKSGDTLSGLAAKYGTTVSAIMTANNMSSTVIYAGRSLLIPGTSSQTTVTTSKTATTNTTTSATATQSTSSSAAASTGATTITIESGDTLYGLALTHGTTVQAIMQANNMSNTTIYTGRTLTIPGASSTTSSSSSSTTQSTTSGTSSSTSVPQRVGNTFLTYTYPQATVDAANVNLDTLLRIGVPTRAEMQALVRQTAVDMGLDPALAQAIAMKESSFNHASVSPANAIGTMQVIPSSGQWASQLVGRELNLLDPQDNVTAGVAILRQLVRTSSSVDIAIASYYQGAGSVARNGMYSDTKQYVASVKALMAQFS